MIIRAENENDRDAVYSVNAAAFETSSEADLVNILREQAQPVLSLVAEDNKNIVGHIIFSPVTFSEYPDLKIMGLAPMAVTSEHQGKGIGSALVRAGLDECKQLGYAAVVVLGHPNFYPRFGFAPSSRFGFASEYDVPDDVFMAIELEADVFNGKTGTVKYHAAFGNL
jgi:putative acetyltransferase